MPRREGGKALAAAEAIGRENLGTLDELIREVAKRVGPRVLEWRVVWGIEPLIGLIVMHTAIVTARQMRLGELAEEMRADKAELDRARSLRLASPSQAVDPAVHTPQRVRAYLAAGGWEVAEGGRVAELWRLAALPDRQVLVPLIPSAPDYAKVLGILASDLAERYGVGELRVLADIEAAADA